MTNFEYWADKIARNIQRDAETTAYLRKAGWTVLRFWEHEDPESVVDRVEESVRATDSQTERADTKTSSSRRRPTPDGDHVIAARRVAKQ